jgi:hypothetical protein
LWGGSSDGGVVCALTCTSHRKCSQPARGDVCLSKWTQMLWPNPCSKTWPTIRKRAEEETHMMRGMHDISSVPPSRPNQCEIPTACLLLQSMNCGWPTYTHAMHRICGKPCTVVAQQPPQRQSGNRNEKLARQTVYVTSPRPDCPPHPPPCKGAHVFDFRFMHTNFLLHIPLELSRFPARPAGTAWIGWERWLTLQAPLSSVLARALPWL